VTDTDAASPAVSGDRWWGRRTLRFRVVSSLLVVLVFAFAVIGVVTVFALNHFLVGRIDQQIGNAGTRYVATAAEDAAARQHLSDGDADADDGFGDAREQAVGTLGARVLHGQLVRFGIVGQNVPTELPAGIAAKLLAVPIGRPHSADLGELGDYRLRAFATRSGERVIVGLPLEPVQETLARLLVIELIVFGVVLMVTVASSRWLVGLSLRPLARVTGIARHVAVMPLSEDHVDPAPRVPIASQATEVGQLGEAFNRMLDHVEASLVTRRNSEDRLRRFIADASHELRTPVAAIRGHAESVRRTPEDVPPEVATAVGRIESETIRMGVLVDDLLLLARLDAGRMLARDPVDLTRIAIDTANDARVSGPDHRWQLDLPDQPVTVTGDDHRLRELVTNLLTNARVHTPAGTMVRLALQCDAVAGLATLSVTDDGPGVPEHAQARVFERFYRADSVRAPKTGSSGLGLAIVAAVAKAHGGDVTLSSEPGRTSFVVRLPLVPQEAALLTPHLVTDA
jgi:two-component system OmpR family sensor kinase